MAVPARTPLLQPLLKEPDPFALDASSEEFFATGDRPTGEVEKIELELEEEDAEIARRSAPEVVVRRRRYRKVVSRVVCGVGVVAIAALGKSALAPANASAFRPAAIARAPQPVRALEPSPQEAPVEEAPRANSEAMARANCPSQPPGPEVTTPAPGPEVTTPAPGPEVATPAPAPDVPAKLAHRAAKRDDDFSDLDVKIDVPKIDISSFDVSVQ